MSLQAKQTAQQRLMLAPNITLALEVLRMPMLELKAYLERQMEENPLLELEEPDVDDSLPSPEPVSQPDEAPTNGFDEEWAAHWQTAGEREDPDSQDEADRLIELRLATSQSLHESLKLQLGCLKLDPELARLGESLIDRLDENGYLEDPLEDLGAELGVDRDRLEAALKVIQGLDPAGVGSRNLRECLLLQLEDRGAIHTLAYRLLKDHFDLFAQHRFNAIAKATAQPIEVVLQAVRELKQLNPKPGSTFSGQLPPTVVPDLITHHRETHYDVELNDQELPRVAISRTYYRMLKDPNTPEDAKSFLMEKFRRAGWLIKAIDERHATLLAIGRCLISLQREFLEQGPQAIRPLTQAQVAGLIGRHPSTVSRAIAGKTIDTPYGVFRLEQLFASSIPQRSSEANAEPEAVSDEMIKSEIQRLIAEEDPTHPLSDASLATRLAERRLVVARRTIAKYRAALKILPAHLRRRL